MKPEELNSGIKVNFHTRKQQRRMFLFFVLTVASHTWNYPTETSSFSLVEASNI